MKKTESYEFFLKTTRQHIDFINKIIEACEGIGNVRTLDANEGIVKILSTIYQKDDVIDVIRNLKLKGIDVEITKQGLWEGEL